MGIVTSAVTAAVVAGAVSGGVSHDSGSGIVITSDHNTIVCCVAYDKSICDNKMTPAQYSTAAGYKTLHKVGYLARPKGCDMIIMEVSK